MEIVGGFFSIPSSTTPPTNRQRKIVGLLALMSTACGVAAWLGGAMVLAFVLSGTGLFVLLVLAAEWSITRLYWRFYL